jgi:hypothetical protein
MISGAESRLRFAARTSSFTGVCLIDWFRVEHYECVYIEGVAASKATAGKLNHLFKCVDGLRMGDEVELALFCISHSQSYSFARVGPRDEYKSSEYANDAHDARQKIEPRDVLYLHC